MNPRLEIGSKKRYLMAHHMRGGLILYVLFRLRQWNKQCNQESIRSRNRGNRQSRTLIKDDTSLLRQEALYSYLC